MAEYLYHTYVYHDTTNVLGVNPITEAANTTDFETNYKSLCVKIDDITPGSTMFDIIKTYTEFKALISTPIAWSDVKYADEGKNYDLYLLTDQPI